MYKMSYKSIITVIILCFINLINYMDRFTIASLLHKIGLYFSLDEKSKGLIQTSFIISYMIFAPLFGYWGDRYSRKNLMIFGILFWSLTTYFGSLVPRSSPWVFLLFRGLVGIGEASYSTLAPTIIADLYSKKERTIMLALFYFAIPVGSGLGYIVGAAVEQYYNNWVYSLRVTPALGILSVVFLSLFVDEPERGQCEESMPDDKNSFCQDLVYLLKNKSYIWSTIGFTCVCFSIGALSWWAPSFITYAFESTHEQSDEETTKINFIFGIITFLGGILGVLIGTGLATWLRKYSKKADPLICAFGVLASVPFIFFAIVLAKTNPILTWLYIFIAITFLCLNWTLVADMLLYLIVPNHRSFAQSIQILFSHLLGDALSPYIVGAIFDLAVEDDTSLSKFKGLQDALYVNCFVLIIGGFAFLYTAYFISADIEKYNQKTHVFNCSSSDACIESIFSSSESSISKPDDRLQNLTESDTNCLVIERDKSLYNDLKAKM